jgi:glycine betaine transporter
MPEVDYGNNFIINGYSYWSYSYYSALTGINKVIKFLADFDFTFSIILMLFIALFLNFNTFQTLLFLQIYHSFFLK